MDQEMSNIIRELEGKYIGEAIIHSSLVVRFKVSENPCYLTVKPKQKLYYVACGSRILREDWDKINTVFKLLDEKGYKMEAESRFNIY